MLAGLADRRTKPSVCLRSFSGWLMVLLLVFPAMLAGSSVSRLMAEETQESCPLLEEIREARLERGGWELVDQSSPAEQRVSAGEGRSELAFFRVPSPRAAEQLARNGCGAPLRC